MAKADYRLCDVCGEKAFYDAELAYEHGPGEFTYAPPYRVAGDPQYDNPDLVERHGIRLGFLGDWSVICKDCAKTHRTRIERITPEEPAKP